mmetsp:Transcript_133771/g.416072  ORF Transcript_133771/g.416072 Transcript_133771/m.416072 type:complete len:284 (-) Transcript_133771:23-874(-)
MNDYSKWDKLQDSDEEREPKAPPREEEGAEQWREDQELVERWLRKQAAQLYRCETPDRTRPPELEELAPYRKATKDELKVLAMLIVISHFEEGTTNLDRHPLMLDLARHNRWLEEDPGTLELLCRVHSQAMRGTGAGTGGAQPPGSSAIQPSPEEVRMRNMCFSGINTLAAPRKAGCPGGMLELVTLICTPGSESARELRKKWEKKEFAKDAIFDSIFPNLRQYGEDSQSSGSMKEVWIVLAVLALFLIVAVLALFGPSVSLYRSAPSSPAPQPPTGHAQTEL